MHPESTLPQSDKILTKGRVSWALYDWANSPYPTIVLTAVFSLYFAKAVAGDADGAVLWSYMLSITGLAVAVSGPLLGAIADFTGRRKPWIAIFTALNVICATALWWVAPDQRWVLFALLCIGLGNYAFEMAIVFYNAMLPDLISKGRMGLLSGMGFGLGYFGALLALLLALFGFVQDGPISAILGLNISEAEHIRILGPLLGLWMAIFSLPLFLYTPDRPRTSLSLGNALTKGTSSLLQTIKLLPKQKDIAYFLFARMVFVDGLNTVFGMAALFLGAVFGFGTGEVITFFILLNVAAGIGSFGLSWIDDVFGAKVTVLISLGMIIITGFTLTQINDIRIVWAVAAILSLFIGPLQSASRTLMGRLAPPNLQGEMFGLYALAGKATAFLGPLVYGLLLANTGSHRIAMLSVIGFLVVGFLIMLLVREPREGKE